MKIALLCLVLALSLLVAIGCGSSTHYVCPSDAAVIEEAATWYYWESNLWPTETGIIPGDIKWDAWNEYNLFVPDCLTSIPCSDVCCDWHLDEDGHIYSGRGQ